MLAFLVRLGDGQSKEWDFLRIGLVGFGLG